MALSSLELEMSMNIARLQADTGKAVKMVEGMARDFKSLLGGVSLAYITYQFKAFVDRTVDAADALNDLRTRSGLSGQELIVLQGAALRGGVALEGISDTVSKLSKRLGAAELGTGEAARGFAAIGLSATRADGSLKNVNEIMREAGAIFAGYEDGMDKATLATAIFGKGGDKLIPVIESLAEMDARFKKLGITIDEDFITAADRYKDTMSDIESLNEVFGRKLVSELLPFMQQYRDVMLEMATNTETMNRKVAAIMNPLKGIALVFYTLYKIVKATAEVFVALELAKLELWTAPKGAAFSAWRIFKEGAERAKQDLKDIGNAADFLFPNGGAPAFPGAPFRDDENWDNSRKNAPKLPELTKGKSPFQKAVEQLEKEAIKAEDLSRRIEVLRDIEAGAYGKLNPLQKEKLETLAKIVDKVKEEIAVRKADIDAQKYLQEEIQKLETLADKWRDLADPIRERNRLIAEGEELMRIGKLTPEQFRIGTMDSEIRGILQAKTLQEKLDEAWNAGKITLEEYQRVLESMNKETEKADTLAHDLGLTFSSAFEDAVAGGKSLRDILSGIEKDLLRLGTRKLVTEPMMKWFEGVMGSGGGGGFSGILSSIFGSGGSNYAADIASAGGGANFPALAVSGYMAHGGAVGGGKSYIVGERGPELFTPSMSGMVTPNGKLGMTVNNVFYLSTPTDKRTQDQISAIAGQSVQRALARNT